MFKISFNRNGETITREFNDYRDLVEYAIIQRIKDEELVSIDVGDGEITGGIYGFANYSLNKIEESRRMEEAMMASLLGSEGLVA